MYASLSCFFAQEKKIPVLESAKLDQKTIEIIKSKNPYLGIIAAYRQIIPQALIDVFPAGIINFHPSFLPELRGPSPVQSAILQNKKTTGFNADGFNLCSCLVKPD